jgi:hypothetical protein
MVATRRFKEKTSMSFNENNKLANSKNFLVKTTTTITK